GIDEGVGPAVKFAECLDRHAGGQSGELIETVSLLQRDQTYAGNRGDRAKAAQRNGTADIDFGRGITLPAYADLQPLVTEPAPPFGNQRRFGDQIGYVGRHGMERRSEREWRAHQSTLEIGGFVPSMSVDQS